jgi:hypothetical protein
MLGAMRPTLATAILLLAACPPPSAEDFWDTMSPPGESSGGSSGGSTGDGSSGGGSTGADPSGGGSTAASESSGPGEPGSTGEEPLVLPNILYVKLSPDPIEAAGPLAVEVHADDTEHVEMAIDGAAPTVLAQAGPGKFVGELAIVSATYNGKHTAVFTPKRADVAGEPVGRSFTAALPKGGSEARWEVSGDLSEALGDAIAVGPDEQFYEFGTTDPAGKPRCYARQRGPNGEYGQDDVIAPVLPDQYCLAKKIALAPDGTIFLLAEVEQDGMKRWWLGRKTSWDSPPENLLWGALGEVASALAVHEDGQPAVCGTVKTAFGDRDAFVEFYGAFSRTFDFKHMPLDNEHWFSEVVHDCVFVDDVIVLAGELWGKHPNDLPMERNRHMVFEYDRKTDEAVFDIAEKGPALYVQSGARAITRDDDDGYVTAGYVCEDPCIPQLHLRQFLAGAEYVDDFMPAEKTTVPTDIARNPSGYVVYTAARPKGGWWSDFWVQAWMPGDQQELWTYARSDEMTTHIAQGVAIGKYGRIFTIGVAQQGGLYRPVIALLNP